MAANANSIQCCGKDRTTRFCPDCGKRLRHDDGLSGLILHCRKNEEKFMKEYDHLGQHDELHDSSFRETRKVAAEKWKSWGDQITELLDKQTDTD